MRRSCLRRGSRAEKGLGLLNLRLSEGLSLLRGGWLLLPRGGAGYLGQGRLLESWGLEGFVRGGGAPGDGRAQEGVKVGATA